MQYTNLYTSMKQESLQRMWRAVVVTGLVLLLGGTSSWGQSGGVREIGKAQTGAASVSGSTQVITSPILITEPGTYRLISNISFPEAIFVQPAIEIRTSFVTLDLNGFTVTNEGNGPAVSVINGASNIVVVNGNLVGAGGLQSDANECRVEQLAVFANAVGFPGRGIAVGANCIVRNNTVTRAIEGILCQACVVSGNTVQRSLGTGIHATDGSVVLGNRVSGSGAVGLRLDDTTGYGNNVLSNNSAATQTREDVIGGVQMGPNVCATSRTCPTAAVFGNP